MPTCWSSLGVFSLASADCERISATPPPGRMPSSTAAPGRVHRFVYAVLLFLALHFGDSANLDYGDAAGKLGQTLLEFLAIVVGGGVLDLLPDLGDARLDLGLLAGPADDGRVVLGDDHLLGAAKHVESDVLKLDAEIFGDHLASGEHGDVLQHGLAAIAKAWGLDGRNLQPTAKLVDHERGESLALDVLGNDKDRLAGLHHLLEQGKQ